MMNLPQLNQSVRQRSNLPHGCNNRLLAHVRVLKPLKTVFIRRFSKLGFAAVNETR
jgi:hypothetical protein